MKDENDKHIGTPDFARDVIRTGTRRSPFLKREGTAHIISAQMSGLDPLMGVDPANFIPTEENRNAWGGIKGPAITKGRTSLGEGEFPSDQSEMGPPSMDAPDVPSLTRKAGDPTPGGGY